MDLYIYSDESGVFDYKHNDIYVYGGLIFVGKDERDNYTRKYLSAERNIAKAYPDGAELKASFVRNKDKLKLFKATKGCIRFGAVVHEQKVQRNIYDHKQSKQRYLDYVYKMALKNAFIGMHSDSLIHYEDIQNLISCLKIKRPVLAERSPAGSFYARQMSYFYYTHFSRKCNTYFEKSGFSCDCVYLCAIWYKKRPAATGRSLHMHNEFN